MAVLGMLGPATPGALRKYLSDNIADGDIPPGVGGIPVNLLTAELLSRGFKILLITLDPTVSSEVILEGPRLKVYIGPWRRGLGRPAWDFFAKERQWILSVIERERPDFLHAQWTYEYAMAAQASGVPHIITAHDAPLDILRFMPSTYRLFRTLMAYSVLRKAQRVVSVAPGMAQHLKRFMLYKGTSEVIPNGMPDALFQRQHVHTSENKAVIFASLLNGWVGLKNPKVLIEAFHLVRREHPDARLIMFGVGHGPGEAGERWAKEKGWDEGIEFVGLVPYQQAMERMERQVDVLVHPSLMEGQPMVLIEGMALGIPVVGGVNSGGVPWTLNYGAAGKLVDVRDPAEVAQAMIAWLVDPDARRSWGERGKLWARQYFHISSVADKYQDIYRGWGISGHDGQN